MMTKNCLNIDCDEQLSSEERQSAIALVRTIVNNDRIETDIHRRLLLPFEPAVPRTNDPSPRHKGCHSPDEEQLFEDVANSINPSKKSYIDRVMSLGGGIGIFTADVSFVERREPCDFAKCSFSGSVRTVMTSIVPSFLLGSGSHKSTEGTESPSSPSKQGYVNITAPQSVPSTRQMSRQSSRQTSPMTSQKSTTGSDSGVSTFNLSPSFSPLFLSPLVEAHESSLHSDSCRALSSISGGSINFTSPTAPPLTQTGPSLRNLLHMGFVRDIPGDNFNKDNSDCVDDDDCGPNLAIIPNQPILLPEHLHKQLRRPYITQPIYHGSNE
jgi:hypothetical protein